MCVVAQSLLPSATCPLPSAFCLLLSAFCLLPSAFCLLLSAFCLLPSAFRLLLSAFCLLPSAFRLLPSAFCLPPPAFCSSDPHRHHHVPIRVILGAIAGWAQLTRAMRILEMKRYLRLRGGSQKIQHVAGIETDLYGTSVVLHRKAFLTLAGLRK